MVPPSGTPLWRDWPRLLLVAGVMAAVVIPIAMLSDQIGGLHSDVNHLERTHRADAARIAGQDAELAALRAQLGGLGVVPVSPGPVMRPDPTPVPTTRPRTPPTTVATMPTPAPAPCVVPPLPVVGCPLP